MMNINVGNAAYETNIDSELLMLVAGRGNSAKKKVDGDNGRYM
jgi:hypothetical protein